MKKLENIKPITQQRFTKSTTVLIDVNSPKAVSQNNYNWHYDTILYFSVHIQVQ